MGRPVLPPLEFLEVAALWLENNEGEGTEREACKVVAGFLLAEVHNVRLKQQIRAVAKAHKVPAAMAREALRRASLKRG